MTNFSRAIILAGLITATGASGALADTRNRDIAQPQESAQQAQGLQEGRAAAVVAVPAQQNEGDWLLDRRSSEYDK